MSIASILIAFIAIEHVGFMILEMFLWKKSLGRKVFRLSAEKANLTAELAMNQGLYNGFLAGALGVGLWSNDMAIAHAFQIFGLICVIAAGVFGALTVNKRIFFVQALPAIIALALISL